MVEQEIGTWSKEGGLLMPDADMWQRRANLRGAPIRFASILYSVFTQGNNLYYLCQDYLHCIPSIFQRVYHGQLRKADRWKGVPTGHAPHNDKAWLPDGYSRLFRSHVFGPSGFWTMAPLRYAAKFDPYLSLDCAPTPSTLAQSKERKGSHFAA